MCVHTCVSLWRPEVSFDCLPELFSTLFWERRSLTESGGRGSWLTWLARKAPGSACLCLPALQLPVNM